MENGFSPSSSPSVSSSSLNDLAQSWGNYRLYRAARIQVAHDPLMQTDNLYLSEGDFVRSGSFRNMRRHLRITSSISRMRIFADRSSAGAYI